MDLGHAAADADRVVANLALYGYFIRIVVLIELFNAGPVDGAVHRLGGGPGGFTRAVRNRPDGLVGRDLEADRTAADPKDVDHLLRDRERPGKPECG